MSSPGSVAVFLGPSLTQARARAILDATYYPPARKGDIYRVMTSGVDTILLIDGLFHNTPSVWQRELLDAVEEGFSVYGASSMGALRAAELHTFGMQGYGVVFNWYRDGLIEGDDEVALLHSTEELQYRALSVPLVNIRYTLKGAVRAQVMTVEQENDILDYLKALPYPERSFQSVLCSPCLTKASPEMLAKLDSYLSVEALDIKMLDATGLLQHVKARQGGERHASQIKSSHTTGVTRQRYERLLMTGFHSPHGDFVGAEVLRRASLDQDFTKGMRAALSVRRFVSEWSSENQIRCPERVVASALERFISGLGTGDLAAWLRRNGLTYASFTASLADMVSIDWIITEGPARFGLRWDTEAEAAAASLFNHDPEVFHHPLTLENLPRAAAPEHAAQARSLKEVSYSQYGFLIAWAMQNGVSPAATCSVTASPEAAEPTAPSLADSQSGSLPPDTPQAWRRALLCAAWAAKQGPEHFGLDWMFELDFLRALQMTDQVERLLSVQTEVATQ